MYVCVCLLLYMFMHIGYEIHTYIPLPQWSLTGRHTAVSRRSGCLAQPGSCGHIPSLSAPHPWLWPTAPEPTAPSHPLLTSTLPGQQPYPPTKGSCGERGYRKAFAAEGLTQGQGWGTPQQQHYNQQQQQGPKNEKAWGSSPRAGRHKEPAPSLTVGEGLDIGMQEGDFCSPQSVAWGNGKP